ncbi:MAG: hypothetical protein GEU88_09830 [Solirubrobacterales bacterium]|nr:hypothetical protein [Solirubrobacterales bacterium]
MGKDAGKEVRAGLAARVALPVVAIAAMLALAAPASADRVTGGKTVLTPDDDTFELLADSSVGIEATGAAKENKNGYAFPIRGGNVKEGPRGSIEHRGGLAFFTEGGAGDKFSQFTAQIGKRKVKVFAKSDKSEIRFLDLDLDDARIGGSEGVNLNIKGEAELAKEAAKVLSADFDVPLRKGDDMGVLKIRAKVG